MKIFHLIDSLSGAGGAEQGLVREVTRFSSDLDQTVIRLFEADDLAPSLIDADVDDRWLGLTRHSAVSAYPSGVRRLVRIIRADRPDVIQTSLFAANIVGQIAGRLTRTPVLSTFTLSGDKSLLQAHQPGAGSRKAELLRRVGAWAARGHHVYFRSLTADAAVTNAKLLGISPERVTVIPRGVPRDLRPDPILSRGEVGLPQTGRLLVNVGREVAQKGQVHLVRLLARLRKDHDDLHLVICGRPGETSSELTALIGALRLQEHVTRLGYTEHVHHVVAHSDLFVFPSLMEGLGTALLEAMAIGTPIVAFDIPPVSEALGDDGGVLVPLHDEEALYRQCRRLLADDAARANQAGKGRARVISHYSIESIAGRVETLLRETSGVSR